MVIPEFKHTGFSGIEVEAQIAYNNYYQLGIPKKFYFHKEFSNPLFLRIFFELLKKIGDSNLFDFQGIDKVIDWWLNEKNIEIGKRKGYDSEHENFVKRPLLELVQVMHKQINQSNPYQSVPYNIAKKAINQIEGANFDVFSTLIDESLITVFKEPNQWVGNRGRKLL